MVGGKRRARRVLGNHQKCWLYGRHVVLETLRAGRWRPLELWLAHDLEPDVRREAARLAGQLGIDVREAETDQLTRRCGGLAHQGLMAKMPPFPYTEADHILQSAAEPPFFALLDGIQDPFNFGAILRSADVFGVNGVFVPLRGQSDVTVQVVRSSAGAVNYVPIAQVDDLPPLIERLRQNGISIVAASEKASRTIAECNLVRGCALIVGNEGVGVRKEVLAACDQHARIPQVGHVGSLNAAVAAGILFYEVRRQRDDAANRSDAPPAP